MSKLLITIHGVNSQGDPLADLGIACTQEVNDLTWEQIHWGRINPVLLRFSGVRYAVFNEVRDELTERINQHPNKEIYLAAHSFGSLAVCEALQQYVVGLSGARIFFTGSIAHREFRWVGHKQGGAVKTVLNIVRPMDWIASRAGWIGGGHAGTRGFISDADNHFKNGNHGSYFPGDLDELVQYLNGTFSVPGDLVTRWEWDRGLGRTRRWSHRFGRWSRILR